MEWFDALLVGNKIFTAATFAEYWTGLCPPCSCPCFRC